MSSARQEERESSEQLEKVKKELESLKQWQSTVKETLERVFSSHCICSICLEVPEDLRFVCCFRGHIVCSACRKANGPDGINYFICPTCAGLSPRMHNVLANNIVQELAPLISVECQACHQAILLANGQDHRTYECTKRTVQCFSCKVNVRMPVLREHLTDCLENNKGFHMCAPIRKMTKPAGARLVTHLKWSLDMDAENTMFLCSFENITLQNSDALPNHIWVLFTQKDQNLYVQVQRFQAIEPETLHMKRDPFHIEINMFTSKQSISVTVACKKDETGSTRHLLLVKEQKTSLFNRSEYDGINFELEYDHHH